MKTTSPPPGPEAVKRNEGIFERLNQSVTKLELSEKLDASKQRFARTVQNLELNEKYNDSTTRARKSIQRINQSVTKLELSEKLDASKQRFTRTVQNLELNERYEKIGGAVGDAASSLAERLKLRKVMKNNNPADSDEEIARRLMLEAEAACTQAMKDHLLDFIQRHPRASYEEWIGELHPENLHSGRLLDLPSKELDHRFYVKESDHRKMWNLNLDVKRKYVPSRTSMWDKTKVSVPDLLDNPNQTEAYTERDAKEEDSNADQITTEVSNVSSDETDVNLLTLVSTGVPEQYEQEVNTAAEVSINQNAHDHSKDPWGDLWDTTASTEPAIQKNKN